MVKRYARLHCNDVEARIKSLAIITPTWANQLRLLKLNIQSISAIIGQGLIAALLPAIKLLNKFMSKLTEAAKKFRDFMYVLFGKKIESPMRGVVDDMAGMVDYDTDLSGISDSAEDVEDGMEDAADGMDTATDSAKKLKKALSVLGFDELNQLNKDLDDLDTSKTSNKKDKDEDLGLDDLGLDNLDDAFDDLYDKAEIEPINEWARRMREAFLNHDWEGLGKVIAELVNVGLKKLYDFIKDITPKIESAMRALAKVINSFVKWLDWDLLGRTIGAGVNLLTRAFNALFDPQWGIKLEELGKGLSKSFRGMIDEIEWVTLGNALGNAFMIPWRIASGFVEDMWRQNEETLLTGWAELGIALAEGVYGFVEKINLAQIGKTLADGFNGIIEVIRNFRNKMYELNVWSELSKKIREGLNELFKVDLKGMAEQLSGLVLDILYMLNDAVEGVDFADFGYRIAEALFSIDWLNMFRQVFDFIAATFGEATLGFINYLTTNAEQLGTGFATWVNTIFDKVKYLADNIPFDDISRGLTTWINTAVEKIEWEENGKKLNSLFQKMLDGLKYVADNVEWEAIGKGIGDFISAIDWGAIFQKVFGTIKEVVGGLISGFADTTAGDMAIKLTVAIGGISLAKAAAPLVGTLTRELVKELTGKTIMGNVAGAISKLIGGAAAGGASASLASLASTFAPVIAVIATVVTALVDLWNTSESFRDAVSDAFTKVRDSLVDAFEKVKEAILPLWESIKNLGASLYDFYENSGLKVIVALFAELLASIGGSVLSTAIDVLATAFSALAEILSGLAEIATGILEFFNGLFTLDLERMGEGIALVGQGIMDGFGALITGLFDIGVDIIGGLLEGILDAVKDIGSWLKEFIVDPFIENFKNLFGIHSPSTVMAEQGSFIMQGLLEGIKSMATTVLEWFSGLPQQIKDALGEAKEWLVEKGQSAIEGLKNGWESVKQSKFLNSVSKISEETKKAIGSIGENIKTKGTEAIEGLKNGWEQSKQNGFLSKVSKITEEVKNAIGNIKEKIKIKGSDAIEGLKNGWEFVKQSKFLNSVSKISEDVKNSIGDIKTKVKSKGANIIEGLKSGFDEKWGGFREKLSGIGERIKNSMPDLTNVGRNLINGFANGFYSLKLKLPHIKVGWNQHTIGNTTFSTPSFGLEWYAKGGLAYNPSVIGVGEAGKEAILPLENKKTMSMIADSITENQSGGIDEDMLANAVAEGVAMALMNNIDNLSGNRNTEYMQNNIYLDGEVMARAISRAQEKLDYRMNATPKMAY